MKTFILAVFVALAFHAAALPERIDIETAKQEARSQNRSLLLDFTGSDWCTACIHLKKNIFSSDEFERAVGERYILVEVDFPRNPHTLAQVGAAAMAEREARLASYRGSALPLVVVMDADGLPYGVISGTRRTPGEYLALLNEAEEVRKRRDEAFAKAAALTGENRAVALFEALQQLPEVCRDKYEAVIAEIMALDPSDRFGLQASRESTERLVSQSAAWDALMHSFAGRTDPASIKEEIRECETFLQRPLLEPEIRQKCLRCMADGYALLRDVPNCLKYLKLARDVAPDSRLGKKLSMNIEHLEKVMLHMEAAREEK